ncbi:MAG: hypothetical protein M0P91_10140 [Sulfuricurvum sp.]|jgi:chemotaxis protein methyltransferase CheR|uniref:CheR family methyltransferase n=1 Tax=Sulfuricurvum sp. TaxID=2025608 RepID=UPI0025EE6008|nr:CheR family methyltransferase [Sulfuricurvum sp.]MCK9373547.1 hypothetical protein [Sulfuricurvum sp.]
MKMVDPSFPWISSERVETFLYQNLGWKIEIDPLVFGSKLDRVRGELGCTSLEHCLQLLEYHGNDRRVIEAFAREFSVGESYFFRDTRFFDQLEHHILPRIIAKNGYTLSVWSVGCSRGEELYSVAMVLRRVIADIDRWNIYLLGTDVNPDVLERAEQGVFDTWSLRQTPQRFRDFFKPHGRMYTIDPAIRKMVHFRYHNFGKDPLPALPPYGGGFDLILLNNVLIYFEPNQAKKAVDTLVPFIKEGGWLATTPAEYGMGVFDFPHTKSLPDGYLLEKKGEYQDESFLRMRFEPVSASADGVENGGSLFALRDNVDVPQPVTMDEPYTPYPNIEQADTYYHHALAMLDAGDKGRAKALLRRSLYLDRGMVMAHVVLGNILTKEGQSEAGAKEIARAKALLQQMEGEEEVALSDGVRASDLLTMLNAIKGDKGE